MDTKDDIKKRLESLPPEIKQLLYSQEVDGIVQQIGVKNKLHLDQTGLLLAEINEVMTGSLDAKDFPQELMEVLQIDRMVADGITQDVNDMLFTKIRESMKRVYEQNTQAPATAAPQNPPAMNTGKSVVMPSSTASTPKPTVTTPPVSVPTPAAAVSTPPKPTVTPAPAIATPSMPSKPPEMHPADVMLTEKTIQVAPPLNPDKSGSGEHSGEQNVLAKPAAYKADPYREPPE